jgi:hypothetical protein
MEKKILTIGIILLFIGTFLVPVCNAFSQPSNPTSVIEEQPDEQNDLEEDEKGSLEPEFFWDYGPYLKATVKGTIAYYYEDFTIFGYSVNPKCELYDGFEVWIYPLNGKEIHIAPTGNHAKWKVFGRLAKWDVFRVIEPYEEYYVEGTIILCKAYEQNE